MYRNFNSVQNIEIEAVDETHEFACTQLQNTLMGRGDIIRETTLEVFNTKNVEDFRSFMKDITLPACESITIQGQAYNGGNKQQLKEAARNQLLENSTLENASTIVQNLCVQCKKILPNTGMISTSTRAAPHGRNQPPSSSLIDEPRYSRLPETSNTMVRVTALH